MTDVGGGAGDTRVSCCGCVITARTFPKTESQETEDKDELVAVRAANAQHVWGFPAEPRTRDRLGASAARSGAARACGLLHAATASGQVFNDVAPSATADVTRTAAATWWVCPSRSLLAPGEKVESPEARPHGMVMR